MNFLLAIGFLLIIGYFIGWLSDKIGLPRIIGYIITGILFSPYNFDFLDHQFIEFSEPLLEISLAFIAFEIGGALRWKKIKKHEKEIISITVMASILPFALIACSIMALDWLFPTLFPFSYSNLLILALLLSALASPTAPAATLAIIHQYHAKGKVTNSVLGVAALDDVLGVLIFSLTIAVSLILTKETTDILQSPLINASYHIIAAVALGSLLGLVLDPVANWLQVESEGQWVVVIFSLIIFCTGISKALDLDILLSSMAMGIAVVNKSNRRKEVFGILERYTEDLIFLFFFLLSGLHLDLSSLPIASSLILLFIVFRTIGKILGAYWGAKFVKADQSIQKYTAGGLLPQAGIVIGLVLSIYNEVQFSEISEVLLATIMGATIINELIGPIAAKYALSKAGEINK
jgi:Kef-type K+ transport system membrane component KefB